MSLSPPVFSWKLRRCGWGWSYPTQEGPASSTLGKEVGNGKLCVWKVRKLDFENQTVETQYPSGYIVNHRVFFHVLPVPNGSGFLSTTRSLENPGKSYAGCMTSNFFVVFHGFSDQLHIKPLEGNDWEL